jgi:hypothetical protein
MLEPEMHEKSLITDEERKRMRDKILDNLKRE